MREVEITRTEVLIVDKVAPHTYQGKTEGIDVYCKDGSKHKVSETHKSLWPVFQPGMAVEVGYGEFNNRPFIHTARQVKDGISPPVPVAPVNAPRNEPQPATQPKEHLTQAVKEINRSQSTNDSIEAQVAVKEILACFREGKLTPESPEVKAALKWCEERIK